MTQFLVALTTDNHQLRTYLVNGATDRTDASQAATARHANETGELVTRAQVFSRWPEGNYRTITAWYTA